MATEKALRPRWKKKRWWAVGLLSVFFLWLRGLYTIPRFPFGPYQLYTDLTPEQRTAKIPYETLSNEKIRPFLLGRRPLKSEFLAAIKRWPDVRRCLVKSERHKAELDLRPIDWNQFWITEDAEICMWRIFTSFESGNGYRKRKFGKNRR